MGCPPSQDSSHHQDFYYIFRIGDPNLNLHLPLASWEWGQPKDSLTKNVSCHLGGDWTPGMRGLNPKSSESQDEITLPDAARFFGSNENHGGIKMERTDDENLQVSVVPKVEDLFMYLCEILYCN